METIILIAAVGLMNVACFFIGARTAQKAAKGETIIPANPVAVHKEIREERRAREEAKQEAEKLDMILQNLERYDGTSAGQQDI